MHSSQNSDALNLVALQDQVAQARQAGDLRVEQKLQLQLAQECCREKQFDRAMEAFGAAYLLSILARDERLLLLSLLGMSALYIRSHQVGQAKGLLELGLEFAREQADRRAEAECLAGLGQVALLTGNPPLARILAEHAREVIRECGDKVAEADVLNLLALARTRLGQVEQAFNLHRDGLLLAREWCVPTVEALHLSNQGTLRIWGLAQPEQGMEDLMHALELFQEQGETEGAAQTLALLAAGAQHQLLWEVSLQSIELARAIPHGLKWLEVRLSLLAANAYHRLGRSEESLLERRKLKAFLNPTKTVLFKHQFEDYHA